MEQEGYPPLARLSAWVNRAPIGIVQDEANAVFAPGAALRDGVLKSEFYSLVAGMISVEFRNGVSMTVKAPDEFEIINEFRVRLNRGNIRAIAPESGHGFIIETPDVDIKDLGTEFGVSVIVILVIVMCMYSMVRWT